MLYYVSSEDIILNVNVFYSTGDINHIILSKVESKHGLIAIAQTKHLPFMQWFEQ